METNIEKYYQWCVHLYDVNRNMELSFIQSGKHVTEPGYQYGPIVRDHYLIHFVKSGKGKLYFYNMVYEIKAGQCFLINPNVISYYQADEEDPWEYYWLGISGVMAGHFLKMAGFSYDTLVLPFYSEEILTNIMEMTYEAKNNPIDEENSYLLFGSLTRNILYLLSRDNVDGENRSFNYETEDTTKVMGRGSYSDRHVNIIVSTIQTSFSQDIRVEEIAEKLNINRSYLSANFKKATGYSIKAFLTNYRIEQSCVLLRDCEKTIAEIANEVGYTDSLYFSRLFKKKMGSSPTDYKKEAFKI